jgi:cysteine desulfuration protein SufE
MPDSTLPASATPEAITKTLKRFAGLTREDKMQTLLAYSRKLEPLPERFRTIDRAAFHVHECQTPVDIIPEMRNGALHFYAAVDTRQSPTVAAFLAIVFSAVNDQPPETTLALPADFVSTVMADIGLGAREVGLNAIVARLKRHAAEASDRRPDSQVEEAKP